MSGLVTVLATQHELQGEKFSGYVKDPLYELLLKELIVAECSTAITSLLSVT